MYRVELTLKDDSKKVFPNMFNEQDFDIWKFKDNWIECANSDEYLISHKKVELIRNSDDEVLVSKEFKKKSKYTHKDPFQYYCNKIYDAVKKDMGFPYYKKDEYDIAYTVLTSGNKYIGYCTICNEIEGTPCNTEAKAFTAIKQQMHKYIFMMGLNAFMKSIKRKKK